MSRKELLERESERLRKASERRDVSFWRPSVGKNVVRILPHWSGDMETVFFKKVKVHFGVGPDKNRVVCRLNLPGRDNACPVDDYVDELLNSGRREDAFIARDIMGRERFVVNMIDVNDPKAGVQVWEMGRGLFNDILLLFLDEEYGDLDNLETGRHITVHRQGEGKLDTRYNIIPSSAVTKVPARVLEKLKNLDDIYPVPTADEIKAIMFGEEYYEERGGESEDILAEKEEEETVVEEPAEETEEEEGADEPEEEEETEEKKDEGVAELEIPLDEEEEDEEKPAKKAAEKRPPARVAAGTGKKAPPKRSTRAERMKQMREKL